MPQSNPGNQFSGTPAILRVVVTSDNGQKLVSGLQRGQFEVTEDGKSVPIESFSSEPGPPSVVVIVDVSGSMADDRESKSGWLKAVLNPNLSRGEWMLITCSSEVSVLKTFGESPSEASVEAKIARIAKSRTVGRTRLYDSLALGIEALHTSARYESKMIILISDGEDNVSASSLNEISRQLVASGIRVYCLFQRGELGFGPGVLKAFVNSTGGFGVRPKKFDEEVVTGMIDWFLKDQRYEYVIGYHSNLAPERRRDKLRVRLPGKKFKCRFTVESATD